MKHKSFQEYLLANNLVDKLTIEERLALQKKWRNAYQKEYHQKYGKKRIRKTITLTKQENTILVTAAKKHKKTLNDFLKESAFAYLNQYYIVPNEKQVQEAIVQMRKIGTLINQVCLLYTSPSPRDRG